MVTTNKVQKIILENRAWKGIRLTSTKYFKGKDKRKYSYSIGRHIPMNKFMLEEEYGYKRGNQEHFYGGAIAYSDNVEDLYKVIEKKHNVQIKVKNPKALKEQIKYSIEENEKTLKKFPSWRV